VELSNSQHEKTFAALKAWLNSKQAYISKKEDIKTSKEAAEALSVLSTYNGEASTQKSQVAPFNALGKEIMDAKYESKLSSYTFPGNADVAERIKWLAETWSAFEKFYATKLADLQDDLARHSFREAVELENSQHEKTFAALKAWLTGKEPYITKRENITNSKEAAEALNVLATYNGEASTQKAQVAPFNALAKKINDAKYESKLSTYTFPGNDAVRVSRPRPSPFLELEPAAACSLTPSLPRRLSLSFAGACEVVG
jgi:hypothetical protein